MQIFIINLKAALQHRHPYFRTKYNKEVLQLINELIKLKVVAYIKKVDGDDLLEIILNLNSNKKKYIRITNMYSRKRQRT